MDSPPSARFFAAAKVRCSAGHPRRDVVAFQLVTVGRRVGQVEHEWFAAGRYRDYFLLHGLGVESAEALAERVDRRIRQELNLAGRGRRFSFGYPACPDLADQGKLWPLLSPGRIGVELTEQFQLDPEQSTSAMIVHRWVHDRS